MSRLALFVLFSTLALPLPPAPRATAASSALPGVSPPAPILPDVPNTPYTLQDRLDATNEEWAVIFPKLQRIAALRDEINATSESVATTSRSRVFNGPMGGTSLDAPVVSSNRSSRFGSREFPFDPQKAPGAGGSSLLTTIAGGIGRVLTDLVKPDAPNSVRTLLVELQTLVDANDTPGWQLLDKLAAVRAARAKATRELTRAQQDLLPLLTTDQIAVLVALGYLE